MIANLRVMFMKKIFLVSTLRVYRAQYGEYAY